MTTDTGKPDAGTELRSAELQSGGKRPDHHDSTVRITTERT